MTPEPTNPVAYDVYYVRDAAALYYAWLQKLTTSSEGADILRALLDDSVLALIKTQHVENPTGNIFTGGLAEPAFDPQLGALTNITIHTTIGAPAAGALATIGADLRV